MQLLLWEWRLLEGWSAQEGFPLHCRIPLPCCLSSLRPSLAWGCHSPAAHWRSAAGHAGRWAAGAATGLMQQLMMCCTVPLMLIALLQLALSTGHVCRAAPVAWYSMYWPSEPPRHGSGDALAALQRASSWRGCGAQVGVRVGWVNGARTCAAAGTAAYCPLCSFCAFVLLPLDQGGGFPMRSSRA